MGLAIFRPSACGCDASKPNIIVKTVEKIIEKVLPGNPNPKNFIIEKMESAEGLLIALIRYPDCKNYEGNKILVFENVTEKQLREATFIDPHFCAKNHMSPIARFEPTERGWGMARDFINTWIRWR